MQNGTPSLKESLNSLESWFNKPLKGDQYQQMVKRLKFIPPRAMRDIVERIIEESPPTPGRFPTVARIKEGWFVWQKENPHMVASVMRTPCRECGAAGFLWATKINPELNCRYEYVFRCDACENWKTDCNNQSPIPLANRKKLKAMGYDLVELDPPPGQWPPPKGGVNKVASETFQSPPDNSAHYEKIQQQKGQILQDEPPF